MNHSQQAKGLFLIIFSGFSWAVAGILSKYMLSGGSTPLLLILSRNAFGTFCLGLFLLFFKRSLFHIDKEDIGTLIVCCIVLFIYSAAYFFCIYFINVSIAVMLLYLYPTIVAVTSVFVYKERLILKVIAALLLTLLGLALTLNLFSGERPSIAWPGIVLGISAAIGAAGYCFYVKKLSGKYHSFTINFYGLLFTVFAYAAMLPFMNHEPLSGSELTVALSAAFPYIGGFLTYAAGVKYLKPSFAAIFGNSEAVFNVLLAAIILGEIITFSQGLGVILIIGAIVLLELPLTGKQNTR